MLAARGDEVRSLIRNPDHAQDVEEAGGQPVVSDLEHDGESTVATAIEGADAVVFAAGAGPGSGPERKDTMDYGGAVKLIAAAKAAGIRRYVIVSSINADPDAPGDDTFAVYLRAKGRADAALRDERARLHDRPARRPHRRPGHRARGAPGARARSRVRTSPPSRRRPRRRQHRRQGLRPDRRRRPDRRGDQLRTRLTL